MSRPTRLVAAALLAGVASLAAPAPSQASSQCVASACYQCFMYPCGPGDWVPFLRDRAGTVACDAVGCQVS
jgi:hypothetical protein